MAPVFPQKLGPRFARRRNGLYVKSEKLKATLFPDGPKRILLTNKPDWVREIKSGLKGLPHHVDVGPITEESFERYDIVVPLSIRDMDEARRHSQGRKIALPLPSKDVVDLCEDKYALNRALIEAGFSRCIPKVAQGGGLEPPFMLKKRNSSWGRECYLIDNHVEMEDRRGRINDPNYFCQELISGSSEFAAHILFVNGTIVKALNIRHEFAADNSISGQHRSLFDVVQRCRYLDLFAQILRTIKYEGLCCIDYKVLNGQPYLLEINPRFGGSLGPFFFSFVRHLR